MFYRLAIPVLSISLLTLASPAAWAGSAAPESASVKPHHHVSAKKGSASTREYKRGMEAMHKAMKTPLSGNADVDFVRQMIPHHQGAVAMAKTQLRYGRDERLKSFSRWIIRAQEQEIAWMENWRERRDNGKKPANTHDYYGPAMATMHHAMMIDYTGDADIDFMRGMIAHHQGALDMASVWFEHGSDPDLQQLARDIYTSQSGEIAIMRRWLAARTTH